MFKKGLGIVLIAAGVLFGIIFTGMIVEDGLFNVVVLFIIAFPVFMLGQLLRLGSKAFKKDWLKFSLVFIQVALLIPLIFLLFNNYNKMKNGTFSREGFLWFEAISTPTLGYIATFLLIILVVLLLSKALYGWAYGGKAASVLILGVCIISALFLFITWSDYRGIHETDGIVISEWTGKEEVIKWSSIERAELIPFVKNQVANKYGVKPVFAWKFEFIQKSGDKSAFESTNLSKFNLNKSLLVKKQIEAEHIPLTIHEMDKKTVKWYEFELDENKLNPGPFNELFNR